MLLRCAALFFAIFCALSAGSFALAKEARNNWVYIGTQGDALLVTQFDSATGTLAPAQPAAQIARPTWLTTDGKAQFLFAVSEIGNYERSRGRVYSYAVNQATGALTALSQVSSGGSGPTHIAIERRANTLFVANFGGGEVAALPVSHDGRLQEPVSVQTNIGRGPHPKQKSAHAHATILDPTGRWLLVPDMGADKVFIYAFDPRTRHLRPAPMPALFTGPGTGPRHLSFSRDGRFAFLITEHSAEIRVLGWNARTGTLSEVQGVPLDPPGFTAHYAAEIAVSPDGRFVYTSNRGRDCLQVFAVNRRSGRLTARQDINSGGKRPRSFAITPSGRWLLAGNQDSQTIQVFSIDRRSGKLTTHGAPVRVSENPVAFAFFPVRSSR